MFGTMPLVIAERTTQNGRSATYVVLTAILLAMLGALSPAGAEAEEAGHANSLSAEGQRTLELLNSHRAAAGLEALTFHPLLTQAAQTHAEDILYNGNYSHWGTDGTTVDDRVARTGYSANPWVSENWVTSSSPDAAMSWWMSDYIHRVNILTPRWRQVGIGVATSAGEMVFVTVFSVGNAGAGDPAAVSAASVGSDPSEVSEAIASPASEPVAPGEHIVQQGETLLGIALRYGYDYADIASANGLDEEDILQIGQVLRIPTAAELAGVGGVGGPSADIAWVGETVDYSVESGDTLFSIASKNGLTWQELAGINGLGEGSLLQIGQTIQVPAAEPNAAVPDAATEPVNTTEDVSAQADEVVVDPDEPAQYHVIVDGDTVIGIALQYGMDWNALLALNGMDETSLLMPGKVLRLR